MCVFTPSYSSRNIAKFLLEHLKTDIESYYNILLQRQKQEGDIFENTATGGEIILLLFLFILWSGEFMDVATFSEP